MGLLIFTCVATCVAIVVLSLLAITLQKSGKYNKRTWLLLLLTPLCLGFLLFGMFTKVGANQVGIIYNDIQGGIQEKTYGEGFHVKSIFEKVMMISTANKTAQLQVAGQTSDSIYADFIVTIVYRIDKENAGLFYKRTNSDDIPRDQLNSIGKECLQASSIKYDIYSILGTGLEDIRSDFTESLSKVLLERYSITVISSSFDDVDAGTRIEEIVRNKGEAIQQIEIEKLNKEKAEIENEKLKVEAQAKAEIVRITAEAEAGRIEIAAEAEAKKIALEKGAIADMITQYKDQFTTLTEQEVATIVLQTIYYERWDGKLPEVLTGDNLEALIGAILTKESEPNA